jgi:hypothetical protein
MPSFDEEMIINIPNARNILFIMFLAQFRRKSGSNEFFYDNIHFAISNSPFLMGCEYWEKFWQLYSYSLGG